MADAWGGAWGQHWGESWGASPLTLTPMVSERIVVVNPEVRTVDVNAILIHVRPVPSNSITVDAEIRIIEAEE